MRKLLVLMVGLVCGMFFLQAQVAQADVLRQATATPTPTPTSTYFYGEWSAWKYEDDTTTIGQHDWSTDSVSVYASPEQEFVGFVLQLHSGLNSASDPLLSDTRNSPETGLAIAVAAQGGDADKCYELNSGICTGLGYSGTVHLVDLDGGNAITYSFNYTFAGWTFDQILDATSLGARIRPIYYGIPPVSPTATPSPTPINGGFATAQPFATQGCVAPTARPSGTPFRTSTPFGSTPTPTSPATATPGGPTATATPTATTAYSGSVTAFTLGPSDFTANLNPWGAAVGPNWGMSGTVWLGSAGWDNLPGVASVPWVDATTNASVYTGTTLFKDALVYVKCDGNTFCIPLSARALRLSGSAKNTRFIAGDSLALHVYALDINYAGYRQQAWFKAGTISIGTDNEWRSFTKAIEFSGGTVREIGGVAIVAAYTQGGGGPYPPLPQGTIQLDHLTLGVGSTTDYVDGGLPVCSPTTGKQPVKTKVCTIAKNKNDVMAACGTIGGITEIGNALNVFKCRLEKYFEFNSFNRQQLLDMRERQAYNEPIGTINDVAKVVEQFQDLLTELSYINTPINYTPFDFARQMSGNALDGNIDLKRVDSTGSKDYLSGCPQAILNWSNRAQKSSCFAIAMLRQTPAVSVMQFMLNGLFLLFLLGSAYRLMNGAANVSA